MGRKMQISCLILIPVLLLLLAPVNAQADTQAETEAISKRLQRTVVLMLNNSRAYVNGRPVAVDGDKLWVTPVTVGKTTMVPLRFVAEGFGAAVGYNANTGEITVSHGNILLSMKAGSKAITKNGQMLTAEEAIYSAYDRTFVPLRLFSEALGKNVLYREGLIIISDTHNVFDSVSDLNVIRYLQDKYTTGGSSSGASSPAYLTAAGFGGEKTLTASDGTLFIYDGIKTIKHYSPKQSAELGSFSLIDGIASMDLKDDGSYLIAAMKESPSLVQIDLKTNKAEYMGLTRTPVAVCYGKGGLVFAIVKGKDTFEVVALDFAHKKELSSLKMDSQFGFISHIPSDGILLLGSSGPGNSGTLVTLSYSLYSNSFSKLQTVEDLGFNGVDMTLSGDGRHLSYITEGGNGPGYTVYDVNPQNLTQIQGKWDSPDEPLLAAFSEDSRFIAIKEKSGIRLFSVDTYREEMVLAISGHDLSRLTGLAFAPEGGEQLYLIFKAEAKNPEYLLLYDTSALYR